MFSHVSKSVGRLLALAFVVAIPLALGAQNSAKSTAKVPVGDSSSRWDIFAGYSFLAPNATVHGTNRNGTENSVSIDNEKVGTVESLSYFFTRHIGLQFDSGQHDRYYAPAYSKGDSNSGLLTAQAGPIYRFTTSHRFPPWVHGLVGGGDLHGPAHQDYKWGVSVVAGGGLDYELSRHWALRLPEVDYQYVHVDYGDPAFNSKGWWQEGGVANIEGVRVAAGVVYHIGSVAPPTPVTLAISASPATVFPGDPVTVTATASNLNPKQNVIYLWSGTDVTGNGATATVATATLAPGTYTVKAQVKEGKRGKEGSKPWEVADASTSFTVKQFEPPTASVSVSPSTIKPGDTATVTVVAVSPQNRPLTYSYSATAGSISGSGATATFSSIGAPTGPVSITATVTDDKGQAITANTTVTITAPYAAPAPHAQAQCAINFSKDKARPARVDNEAKACLDEIALDLQKQSDAKAVVVGNSNAKEKAKLAKQHKAAQKHKHVKVVDLAAERAVNTKAYLVTEKGIDSSRVSVATGTADGQSVEDYLVPSGATFTSDVTGTTEVNEGAVKAQPRKALVKKHAHKKAADTKSAQPEK